MAERVAYVCVGGPPDDWSQLIYLHTDGRLVNCQGLIEIDAEKGWLRRWRIIDGQVDNILGLPLSEVIHGNFEIWRRGKLN